MKVFWFFFAFLKEKHNFHLKCCFTRSLTNSQRPLGVITGDFLTPFFKKHRTAFVFFLKLNKSFPLRDGAFPPNYSSEVTELKVVNT